MRWKALELNILVQHPEEGSYMNFNSWDACRPILPQADGFDFFFTGLAPQYLHKFLFLSFPLLFHKLAKYNFFCFQSTTQNKTKPKPSAVLIWSAITIFFPEESPQPDLPSQVLCFVFYDASPLYKNTYDDSKIAILRPVSLRRNRHKTPEFRCGFLILESPFAQPLRNIALK